ncbi:MAG: sensor histidine kinase KdpD [Deltaproteobacteria bacterium]|nr:sensor histidine kinase KdpD [Deltaproteobacteria bacterium]
MSDSDSHQDAAVKEGGRERILVGVSPSPFSIRLVRAARRMADGLKAEWYAVHVETPSQAHLSSAEQERLSETLRLAAQWGAQSVRITGTHVRDEIMEFAREHDITKIVVGKPLRRRLREVLLGSVADQLIWNCGDIDVYVISGEGEAAVPTHRRRKPVRPMESNYLWAAGIVGACTVLAWVLFPYFHLTNLVMIYFLGVVAAASLLGRGPSILASCLSVAAFDFFFVPPYLTFVVENTDYAVTLMVMLLVGAMISTLTARVHRQAESARHQERQTAALYEMSRSLTAALSLEDLLQVVVKQIARIFECRVSIMLPDDRGVLVLRQGDELSPDDEREALAAQWVFQRGGVAGAASELLAEIKGLYLPLRTSEKNIGVMRLETGEPQRILDPESLRFLEALGGQAALAIERENLLRQAQTAQVQRDSERMRNILLSSVSHDLRTPLTVIAGSASTLVEGEENLDDRTKRELVQSIYDEARRLDRLVHNLLDMSRLQAGEAVLNREWHLLEEVLGTALVQLDLLLKDHPLIIKLPPDLPLIKVDGLLLERVLVNLLENSIKYSPPGSLIEVTSRVQDQELLVEIADRGPGLPPGEEARIFEKFHRVAPGRVRGTGLGLTICRNIIESHGGRIWAANRPEGGAVFRFTLPLGDQPPALDKPSPEMLISPHEGENSSH